MSSPSAQTAEAIDRYETELRAELADLPSDEADSLVGDVRYHLEELVAENDEPGRPVDLVSLIGEPSAYAAELRAAAGLPPARPARTSAERPWATTWLAIVGSVLLMVTGALLTVAVGTSTGNEGYVPPAALVFVVGLALTVAVRADRENRRAINGRWASLRDEMEHTARGRRLLAQLRALESGWWLVRAYPAVMLVELLASDDRSVSYPLPSVLGTGPFGGAGLLCLAAVVSIWIGDRFERTSAGRWAALAVNLVLLAGLAALLFHPGEWTPNACNGWPGC